MSSRVDQLLCLDVGSKRIGVARGDSVVKIAVPLTTLTVDGTEQQQLRAITDDMKPTVIVVGYPRNQAGEATAQTRQAEAFASALENLDIPVVFQDESLTSVIAEQRLARYTQKAMKHHVDAEAAAIILQDYIEATYGR